MQRLINLMKDHQVRQLSNQQIGITVDYLYQLDYFHQLAQQFGKFYLSFLVQNNFINIYSLRKDRLLIDTKHNYVLIQGSVNRHGFKNGAQIIIQRDGHIQTLKDSIFFKISIEKMNHQPKLKLLQKSINKNRFIFQTLINENQHKKQLLKKLQNIEIFSQLSKYDFIQLINGCQYKILFNGKRTHQFQKPVKSLIYIMQGQIKLSFPYNVQQNPAKIDQFLQKYLIQKPKSNKKEITSNFTTNQWIGIDEHFQTIFQKSSGIVTSVEAQLLYIPIQLFDKIFNQKNNHTLFTKINFMRNIKAEMLEKSLQTQIQKQLQTFRYSQENNLLPLQLRRKLSKYHIGEQLNQTMTNPEYDSLERPRKKILSFKPNKITHLKSTLSPQKESPINFKNSLPVSLNKLQKKQFPRVNLFPQQYSKKFILPSQQREIDQAQAKKNINLMMYLQPKHHRKACQYKKNHQISQVNGAVFEKKLLSMAKNITQNFALCSTFYRDHFNKGDQFSNLNLKTIVSIQPSKKELLLNRKNQNYRQALDRQSDFSCANNFILPGLKNKSQKKYFQPMSPRKNTVMDLSQHLLNRNYNVESKNTMFSKHKQSSHTIIPLRNQSSRTINFRNHSKTMFVKPQNLQKSKISRTIDYSSMIKKRCLKKEPSFLNIL